MQSLVVVCFAVSPLVFSLLMREQAVPPPPSLTSPLYKLRHCCSTIELLSAFAGSRKANNTTDSITKRSPPPHLPPLPPSAPSAFNPIAIACENYNLVSAHQRTTEPATEPSSDHSLKRCQQFAMFSVSSFGFRVSGLGSRVSRLLSVN